MLRLKNFFLITLVAGLGACGGSSEPGDATLTIGLTDAAVDDISALTISFVGVTVKPQEGEQISWSFEADPREIDLVALQGGVTAELLTRERVPSGRINWIAIDVNPDPSAHTAEVTLGGQIVPVEIDVPSDRIRFVSGVTFTENGDYHFVIDWDLLRSVTWATGREVLKVRPAWRVVDMQAAAAIGGTVAASLVNDDRDAGGCAELNYDTMEGNSVYLYNLMPHDAVFDDIYITDMLEEGPIGTAQVMWNGSEYVYKFAAVTADPTGYTLAFTCQAHTDSPDVQTDDIEFRAFVDVAPLDDGVDVLDANFVAP